MIAWAKTWMMGWDWTGKGGSIPRSQVIMRAASQKVSGRIVLQTT